MRKNHQNHQLDTIHHCATPEHISFEFRLAGPMLRAFAWLIDMVAVALIAVVVFVILNVSISSNGLRYGLLTIFSFFILWLYDVLLEWLWQGFTPGKKILGIRVIGVDGLPLNFRASFLRNTIRYVDWLPLGYSIGLITMFFNGRFQRLGDLAAGTVVVYVDDSRNSKPVQIKNKNVHDMMRALPAHALSILSSDISKAIANYANTRLHYHPDRRNEIAAHLATPLGERLQLQNVEADVLLSALYMKLFHSNTEQSMGAKAASFLNSRRPMWEKLEHLLLLNPKARSQHSSKLSQYYRAACADLALADAYQLPAQNVNYLHSLVSRSHLRFYQRVQFKWRDLSRLIFNTIPQRLYHDSCLRIAMIAFFGVCVGCALLSAFDSSLAVDYLGSEHCEQMQDMYSEAPHGRSDEINAAMGGFYLSNNVGLSFNCFAYGIFAGVGSLILLLFNGLNIGLTFGFMASSSVNASVSSHFFEFIVAHGPFELCGIVLSGAAGLRLGLGLLITHGLPRLESLQKSALESVPLMCVAACSIALAAPIEAFISPSALPVFGKVSIGVISLMVIISYLLLGARSAERNFLDSQDTP